jgi:hypothetical protein
VVPRGGTATLFLQGGTTFISYKQQQQTAAGSGLSSGKFTVERSVLALGR